MSFVKKDIYKTGEEFIQLVGWLLIFGHMFSAKLLLKVVFGISILIRL